MIELTFLSFHEQQYQEQQFCLYVVRNASEDVLYVGISLNDIWERWFGWGGHMTWDGSVPDSLKWKIQLWSLKDCFEFCRDELPTDTSTTTVHDIEPIMIRKFSPTLNGTHILNRGKDNTPKSKRDVERENALDQAYKEIFDKQQH